ncbi:MAG: hypothetical protein LBC61_02520 [Candidatus Peribacteria bacterium]|nr:hypothetical protein [Candidatus Peribacteria bacterium]
MSSFRTSVATNFLSNSGGFVSGSQTAIFIVLPTQFLDSYSLIILFILWKIFSQVSGKYFISFLC